jgi:PadR family transcriptional regulator, regulatory protein PadR
VKTYIGRLRLMKLTNALVEVALAVMSNPNDRLWGYELSRQTGLRSGVLYPILHRMLDEGWLVDGWEELDPSIDKRPPRRYYRLTDKGSRQLGALLQSARNDRRFAALKPAFNALQPRVA